MAYTGTDLNKAERGYVDEQDQALQDQIDLADFVTELDANDFDAESYFKVEDDGSGTNNVFVPKTIAEMKADLGLPKEEVIVYPTIYMSSGGVPQELMSVRINTTSDDPTITKTGVGKYNIDFISSAWAISSAYSTLSVIPFKSSMYNNLPTDYTMEVQLNSLSYIEVQFKHSGTNAELPNDTLINLLIQLKRYI